MEKVLVLFSGGLDSRLVVKIMQKKYKIFVMYFRLPFSKDNIEEVEGFLKKHKIEYKIYDCTRGKLLKEYLDVIRVAKNGRGKGVNPCIDCKIFMLKKANEFARKNEIKFIATGEVLGQRPMSQKRIQLEKIKKESGAENILRPLSDIYKIQGRKRSKQIELARKFRIEYPSPAGGCLLCEKNLVKRFNYLIKRGINERELKLVGIGRHFVIDGCWIVLGRDETENKIIEEFAGAIIPDFAAPSAIFFNSFGPLKKVNDLIKAYSKKGSLAQRKKFEKYKL